MIPRLNVAVDSARAMLFLLPLAGSSLSACGPAQSEVTSPTVVAPAVSGGMPSALPPAQWYRAGASNEGVVVEPGNRVVLLLGERVQVAADGSVTSAEIKSPERLMQLAVLEEDGKLVLFGASYRAIYRFDQPLGAGVQIMKPFKVGAFAAMSGKLCVAMGQTSLWFDGHGAEAAPPPGIASCHSSIRAARASGPEPPLVTWLRRTRWAPLEAAAMGGVEAGPGRALVVGGGLAMVVDLTSGLPIESTEVVMPVEASIRPVPWRGVSFEKEVAFINVDEEPADSLGGGLLLRAAPRWVVSFEKPRAPGARWLFGPPPSVAPFEFEQDAGMYASASGALLVIGACPADRGHQTDSTLVCVRQPDGSSRSRPLPWSDYGSMNGVGATADGGLVVASWQNGALRFERIDTGGVPHLLAVVPNVPEGMVRLLDEDALGNVHALVRKLDGQGVGSIWIDPSGHVVVKRFETGYAAASYRGRVVVRDEDALHISLDAGASWERVEAPSPMDGLRVSEIGFAVPGHYFRIGWGPQEKLPPEL